MSEQLDLTTPRTKPSVVSYTISSLQLNWVAAHIQITLVGSDGEGFTTNYIGAEATSLMTALNTANLSIKSLYRRILEKLVSDGRLPPGMVSGTPQ